MVMIISLSLYFSSLLPLPAFSLPKSILLRGHSPLITVLVRVLQKEKKTELTGYLVKGFIIRNLLTWLWRLRRPPDLQWEGLITRLVNDGSSSLSVESQEKKNSPKGQGKQNCLVWQQISRVQHCFVLFRLLLVGWSPLTLGKAICFMHSINTNIKLIQKHPPRLNTLTDTPKTVFKYLLTTWPC